MSRAGKFVVIEGIDNSGKSTLCKNLFHKLNETSPESKALFIRYPDRSTSTGQLLDKYLKKQIHLNKETSHLLFSANRWEKNEEIKELIKSRIVISDRYYFSGMAYSMAIGADSEWVKGPDKGLLEPDILLFLDTRPMEATKRMGFGNEIYDNLEMQEKIYRNLKGICTSSGNCFIINGGNSIEKITEDAFAIINSMI